jgi:hypothetical protein
LSFGIRKMQVKALRVGARKPYVSQLMSFHPRNGVMGIGLAMSRSDKTHRSHREPTKQDDHQAHPPCWSGWVRGFPSCVTIA